MTSKRAVAAVGLGGGLVLLAAVSARPPEAGAVWRLLFVGASLGGCALLVWVLRWWSPSVRELFLWAVALRLAFFPLLPSLSDDGYRYLWDGMLQVEGISPYAFRPSDPELEGFHDSVLYERMNSREYYSVYPPVSQLAFRAAAPLLPLGWAWAWYGLKGIVLLAEGGGLWGLIRLAGARRAALYALHPVAVVEVAGQAHTEGLLVGALGLVAFSLLGRTAWGGVGGALAFGVKLWPAAWLPALLRISGRRGAWASAAVLLGALVGLAAEMDHVLASLGLYAGTFDFYSAPYRIAKAVLYPVLEEGSGRAAAVGLQGVWVGAVLIASATVPPTPAGALRAVLVATMTFVVTASTLHPWHLLAALWFIPLLQQTKPWYWLVSLSSSTYTTYVWDPGLSVATLIGWGGAAGITLWLYRGRILSRLMRARAQRKMDRVIPYVPRPLLGRRLLDLGAGEGYVGLEVGRRTGASVRNVDVVVYANTEAEVELYDGDRLPYPDGHFDASLLIFVLHHASDPIQVVREAARATEGPVVVLETVCFGPRSRAWLERVDRWANRLRSGGRMEEAALHIRTDEEWTRAFQRNGLRVVASRRWRGLHPQSLYVLDGHPRRSSRSSAEVSVRSAQTASG